MDTQVNTGCPSEHALKCEHPVIIINPRYEYYMRNYRRLRYFDSTYYFTDAIPVDRSRFGVRKNNITYSDVDKCYFVDDITGDIQPLYLVVPCGRCVLCRQRKAREYMARCTGETNQYDTIPLFLTFTYSDKYLPAEGLRKEDLQMFFKRLRSRLDYYKIPHNIRYFAVGEYGSKTGRAHYHAIIWNFPDSEYFPNIISVQKFIQRCWSRWVYSYDKIDGKAHRVAETYERDGKTYCYRYPSGAIKYQTEPIGWVHVLNVKEGCTAYVTKYLRKGSNHKPGQTECFQLSSRRGGGIGAAAIEEFKDYFTENPDVTDLPIKDKFTGKVIQCPITTYVKEKLMPSVHRIDERLYEDTREFFANLRFFQALTERIRQRDILDLDRYDYASECFKHWYDPFSDITKYNKWMEVLKKTEWSSFAVPLRETPVFERLDKEEIWQMISDIMDRLNNLSQSILVKIDTLDYLSRRDLFLNVRRGILSKRFVDADVPNVPLLVQAELLRQKRSALREIF